MIRLGLVSFLAVALLVLNAPFAGAQLTPVPPPAPEGPEGFLKEMVRLEGEASNALEAGDLQEARELLRQEIRTGGIFLAAFGDDPSCDRVRGMIKSAQARLIKAVGVSHAASKPRLLPDENDENRPEMAKVPPKPIPTLSPGHMGLPPVIAAGQETLAGARSSLTTTATLPVEKVGLLPESILQEETLVEARSALQTMPVAGLDAGADAVGRKRLPDPEAAWERAMHAVVEKAVQDTDEMLRQGATPEDARKFYVAAYDLGADAQQSLQIARRIVATFGAPLEETFGKCHEWMTTNLNASRQAGIRVAIAEAYYRQRLYDKSLAELGNLPDEASPEGRSAAILSALCLVGNEKHADAIRRLEAIVGDTDAGEHRAKALFVIGWTQVQRQDYAAAKASLDALVARFPESSLVPKAVEMRKRLDKAQ